MQAWRASTQGESADAKVLLRGALQALLSRRNETRFQLYQPGRFLANCSYHELEMVPMNWFDGAAVRGTTRMAAACLQSGLVMFLIWLRQGENCRKLYHPQLHGPSLKDRKRPTSRPELSGAKSHCPFFSTDTGQKGGFILCQRSTGKNSFFFFKYWCNKSVFK